MSDSSNDEYEPAIDGTATAEAGAESEPVVKRSVSAAAEAQARAETPVQEDDTPAVGPRMPRQRSDRNRAMFREIVNKVRAGEVETDGDLEPMVHVAKPAPVPAPAAAAPAPAPAPASAPVPIPPGLPPLPDMPLPGAPPPPVAAPAPPDPRIAEREAALTAREAALAAREKQAFDRTALAERPAEVIETLLRDAWGIDAADTEGFRTSVADLVTELSIRHLGVQLPDEVKSPLESRRALRSVKAYKTQLERDRAAVDEQRKAAEKQAAEARVAAERQQADAAYQARIAELIAPAKDQHRYLHDPDITDGLSAQQVVYEVLKEQQRLGHKPDLATAVEYANNFYKDKFERAAKMVSRYSPAPAPAASVKPPSGAPSPAPATPPKPQPTPEEWDPSDLPMDRQQRRQASLAKIIAARKAAHA